ncbi:hypothetical protein ACQJBY_003222 [Aegilops geniculata]
MRIQRQRRILKQRLKVPPTLHQFTRTLDKNLDAGLHSSKVGCTGALGRIPKKNHTQQCVLAHLS